MWPEDKYDRSRVIGRAIHKINPEAHYTITAANDRDLDGAVIEWLEGTTPISKADIAAKMDEEQIIYDNRLYRRQRRDAIYKLFNRTLSDGDGEGGWELQLDLMFHDMEAGKFDSTGEWFKAIKEIKDKYPKP